MSTFDFKVKHAGQVYPVTLSLDSTVTELKSQMEELTKIPAARQKYMVRGGLSDDNASNLSSVIKPGSTVMLLGTPDSSLLSKPAETQKFIEDLSPDQQVQQFDKTPIGFQNMGNTCYMNATLQVLYKVPFLQELIISYDSKSNKPQNTTDEVHHNLVLELKRNFESLKNKQYKSVMPIVLLNVLRKCYPQFAERDPSSGFYKQQDAEELFTQLFHSLNVVFGDKVMEQFRINFKVTVSDTANPDDVTVREESDLKLQCHISGSTNFMKNGLVESLHEKIEKRSPTTNVNSVYSVEKQIKKLPQYLTVQYVRFFWKRSTNKKSKILRKVVFPFQLDVSEMLTPEYAQEKIKVREELRLVDKERFEKERESKKRKVEELGSTPLESHETKVALRESELEHWKNEFKKHFPSNLAVGENPSSVYDLIGIITHQGANSESGHYQAFIRDDYDDNVWYKFNDDKVTIVEKEKIEALAGGGESDSALILMYKGFGL